MLTPPDDTYYNVNYLTISYARILNDNTVISNIATTSVSFPTLTYIEISESEPEEYSFDLEGAIGNYIFTLSSSTGRLDINSEILIFFPSYYSSVLSNDDNSLQCLIYHPITLRSYLLECNLIDHWPYILNISQLPFSID